MIICNSTNNFYQGRKKQLDLMKKLLD